MLISPSSPYEILYFPLLSYWASCLETKGDRLPSWALASINPGMFYFIKQTSFHWFSNGLSKRKDSLSLLSYHMAVDGCANQVYNLSFVLFSSPTEDSNSFLTPFILLTWHWWSIDSSNFESNREYSYLFGILDQEN